MCDYSLEMYASRPARESEKYVTTRFPSGSIGLAVPGDCKTAVCVQYDTHLKLADISSDLQTRLNIAPEEEVVFARLEHGAYRDGLRFSNGKEVSLQLLGAGVSIELVEVSEKVQPVAEPATQAVREPEVFFEPEMFFEPRVIRETEPEPVARAIERVLEPVD